MVGSGRAPGYAVLERPSAQGLPRLKVVGGRVFDEAAIVALYTFAGRVLDLRRPFTCMWDPRPVQWPKLTPSMFRTIRAWVDENARAWDTHVQAHAIPMHEDIAVGALLTERIWCQRKVFKLTVSAHINV